MKGGELTKLYRLTASKVAGDPTPTTAGAYQPQKNYFLLLCCWACTGTTAFLKASTTSTVSPSGRANGYRAGASPGRFADVRALVAHYPVS